MSNQNVHFKDLGLIAYKPCWELQEKLSNEIIEQKLKNRELPQPEQTQTNNHLLFCEHPHVYTLGKSGNQNNLLLGDKELKEKDALFYKVNRGGDITYHGPGQLVGYPIFDLENFFSDLIRFIRYLEEAVILTLKEYGIEAGRIKEYSGVWLDVENPAKARKICAVGIHASRWVTMHGFALNVNTDLDYFNHIIPCGITGKGVTSISKELGKTVDMDELKVKLKKRLAEVFGLTYL